MEIHHRLILLPIAVILSFLIAPSFAHGATRDSTGWKGVTEYFQGDAPEVEKTELFQAATINPPTSASDTIHCNPNDKGIMVCQNPEPGGRVISVKSTISPDASSDVYIQTASDSQPNFFIESIFSPQVLTGEIRPKPGETGYFTFASRFLKEFYNPTASTLGCMQVALSCQNNPNGFFTVEAYLNERFLDQTFFYIEESGVSYWRVIPNWAAVDKVLCSCKSQSE